MVIVFIKGSLLKKECIAATRTTLPRPYTGGDNLCYSPTYLKGNWFGIQFDTFGFTVFARSRKQDSKPEKSKTEIKNKIHGTKFHKTMFNRLKQPRSRRSNTIHQAFMQSSVVSYWKMQTTSLGRILLQLTPRIYRIRRYFDLQYGMHTYNRHQWKWVFK